MGIMELVGGLFGGARPKSGNPVLDAVLPLLLKKGGGGLLGGLSGVLGSFSKAGLGKKADSWVASGPNEELTPDEVERALGDEKLAKLAARAGVPVNEASAALSKILPKLVDQLTPGGSVPVNLKQAARRLDLSSLLVELKR